MHARKALCRTHRARDGAPHFFRGAASTMPSYYREDLVGRLSARGFAGHYRGRGEGRDTLWEVSGSIQYTTTNKQRLIALSYIYLILPHSTSVPHAKQSISTTPVAACRQVIKPPYIMGCLCNIWGEHLSSFLHLLPSITNQ